MREKIDIVYVVASKLGSIGMGTASYNAVKGIERSGRFSFNVFCRGYDSSKIDLKKENIISYGFLEYLSYPFRFLEKVMKIRTFDYFKCINKMYGDLVFRNLPECKIYHSWMGFAPEAALKAKKQGAVLVLEAANSHLVNTLKICNEEYFKFGKNEFIAEPAKLKKDIELIKRFDYVMCPSDFVYDSFLEQGFSEKQLVKVPYGVDIEKFKPSEREKDGKFRAVFVGSIQLRKGLQYLLEAWNELKLKNAELVIVGRVWPDAENVFSKYMKNPSIKFLNFDSDLRKYYSKSDVFIFPSLEEGSCLVNYEAMASGLPIITTHNSGSVVRDGKDGFIVPIRNTGALKDKIKYLYDNPEIVKKMGASARKHVENYSWEKYGERLVMAYEKIMKKHFKN